MTGWLPEVGGVWACRQAYRSCVRSEVGISDPSEGARASDGTQASAGGQQQSTLSSSGVSRRAHQRVAWSAVASR